MNRDATEGVFNSIEALQATNPDYVSVTYSGTHERRRASLELIEHLIQNTRLRPLAHLTCVGESRQSLENLIRQHRWVSQCVIYGDRRQFLTAMITLDPDEAAALAEAVGTPGASVAELSTNEAAIAEIQSVIDGANAKVAKIAGVSTASP